MESSNPAQQGLVAVPPSLPTTDDAGGPAPLDAAGPETSWALASTTGPIAGPVHAAWLPTDDAVEDPLR